MFGAYSRGRVKHDLFRVEAGRLRSTVTNTSYSYESANRSTPPRLPSLLDYDVFSCVSSPPLLTCSVTIHSKQELVLTIE